MNFSSLNNPISTHDDSIIFSNSKSLLRGGFKPGKRSDNRPKNTSRSVTGNFGKLKSLKALNIIASSESDKSALLKEPATTNTDLIALSPQS